MTTAEKIENSIPRNESVGYDAFGRMFTRRDMAIEEAIYTVRDSDGCGIDFVFDDGSNLYFC